MTLMSEPQATEVHVRDLRAGNVVWIERDADSGQWCTVKENFKANHYPPDQQWYVLTFEEDTVRISMEGESTMRTQVEDHEF